METLAHTLNAYSWDKNQQQQVLQDTNMATLAPKSKVAGLGDPEGCLEVGLPCVSLCPRGSEFPDTPGPLDLPKPAYWILGSKSRKM